MAKGRKSSAERTAQRGDSGKPATRVLRRPDSVDPQALLHELGVHQIELEMQNEELRATRMAAESALVSYAELFEFAPVGYATIAADHTIYDINQLGARLLGRERTELRGWRFEMFADLADAASFRALLEAAESTGHRQSGEIHLNAGGKRLVRLSAVVLPRAEPRILLTFEDIGERQLPGDLQGERSSQGRVPRHALP